MDRRPLAEKIFEWVSERVTPSSVEAAVEKRFARRLATRIEDALGGTVSVRFVGSTARDTGLKNDRDIDLFVGFPQNKSRDHLVKTLGKALQTAIPASWEMHYAEHPYYQARIRQYKVEVIPCYTISKSERIISAVDRTPLHMTYLQEKLTALQRRDVRVLKKLLKSHGIYGAEAEVQGFSGLVCEYLILNFRNLFTLLEHVSDWRPPVLLDIENAYEGIPEDMQRRFPSPLVLVDFIDATRNAGAAVSEENLAKFIVLARRFTAKPGRGFFFPVSKRRSFNELTKGFRQRMPLVLAEFPRPDALVSDILVPQLRRTERSLRKHLEIEDFTVHDSVSFLSKDSCYILLELEHAVSSKLYKVYGPPVYFHGDLERFLDSHPKRIRGPFVEGSKVVVEEPRPMRTATQLLEQVREHPPQYAVASHLVKPFSKARFIEKENLLIEAKRNKTLRDALMNYVFKEDAYLRGE
ncbi:CCA tRNA nucleotidyltransferase [Candidatus Micrarchaeota archaeon]|nr:CCA tRNA nucleotidyltransferase [Candidatus Micrarchaeota archaeon]